MWRCLGLTALTLFALTQWQFSWMSLAKTAASLLSWNDSSNRALGHCAQLNDFTCFRCSQQRCVSGLSMAGYIYCSHR